MLTLFDQKTIADFTNKRIGEKKIGESIKTIPPNKNIQEAIHTSDTKFVILGVPEDIGVRMNGGKGGAHTAFIPAIKAFLNIQQNQFIDGRKILILGYLDCFDKVANFDASDREKSDLWIKSIDEELASLVKCIINSEKIPIIIGGGHNNAYGNLKGLFLAKKQPIHAVNLDAHTDLRLFEERHSGNGFSCAIAEGILENYFIFGLHENYTPQYIFDQIHSSTNLEYTTFEDLEIYAITSFKNELQRAENFIQNQPFGVEIDLDSVQNFPSSAMTPSGFTPQQTRRFAYYFGKNKNAFYLHICEGAPIIKNKTTAIAQVGKFISYIISDFIKAKERL